MLWHFWRDTFYNLLTNYKGPVSALPPKQNEMSEMPLDIWIF